MDLGIRRSDRVLVLGATGWFGRSALSLLSVLNPEAILCVSSQPVKFRVNQREFATIAWDLATVRDFRPTIVLNFAFLTREKWRGPGDLFYEEFNQTLIHRMSRAVSLPSVRLAVTLSSGAALLDAEGPSETQNPYGRLKLIEERSLHDSVCPGASWIVARGWSFSGPFVTNPSAYLFSDLIQQARTGQIRLRSTCPVLRRYIPVEDFIKASLLLGIGGWSGLLESGGELTEAGALADAVSTHFGGVPVFRDSGFDPNVLADSYFSDNSIWAWAMSVTGIREQSIPNQIQLTAAGAWK